MEERPTVVVASAAEGVCAQLKLTLGEERFRLEEAHGTDAAATQIAEHQPDLVVVDAELPGDGASNLVTSLRAQSETAEVPILLLSPRDREIDDLTQDVDATVGLPATSFALLRRIEELLGD